MSRLRETVPGYDPRSAAARALAIADAVTPPKWSAVSERAGSGISHDASSMPNPPHWLEVLDLTPWARNRVENTARLRGTR